ncbi:MAG: hypothetical protein V1704_04085 [Candidatus Vogelbacteria bacterium]
MKEKPMDPEVKVILSLLFDQVNLLAKITNLQHQITLLIGENLSARLNETNDALAASQDLFTEKNREIQDFLK